MAQKLDANLNVIQETPIELELINGDLSIISKLDDEPNDVGGLTSTQLKAKFDEAGNIIKEYLNESLIPAVLAADATEATRSSAEAERVENEVERVANENVRVPAETARIAAENIRIENEATRVASEEERIDAEATRKSNEAQRIQNENAREDLETGYVARAEAAAQRAEKAAAEAEGVAGGESDVFIAQYGVTSFADIEAAYNAGKAVFVSAGTSISPLVLLGGSEARFNSFQDTTGKHRAFVNDLYEGWSLSTVGSLPASHASQHKAGGADPITLDSLTITSSGGKVFKLSVSDSGTITAVQV